MADTSKTKELTEVSEAQIAVHWKEEEYRQPSEQFKAQATMRDPHILEKFGLDNFPDCFRAYADMLTWFEPYHTVLDTGDAPFWKWFVGGKINASYNCVDRHLAEYGNKAAFIFVPEPPPGPGQRPRRHDGHRPRPSIRLRPRERPRRRPPPARPRTRRRTSPRPPRNRR